MQLTDEGLASASCRMRDAVERANAAAEGMTAAAQRFAQLLEDGYGGNGARLLEALERQELRNYPMGGIHFDNQIIDITGESFEDFKKALSFFFEDGTQVRKASTVEAYGVDPKKGLILFWWVPDNVKAKANPANAHSEHVRGLVAEKTSGGGEIKLLPYEMAFDAALHFTWNWLSTDEAKNIRGPEPDHDGDNAPAWRVYNERWTHVDEFSQARVGIQPVWAMYGK